MHSSSVSISRSVPGMQLEVIPVDMGNRPVISMALYGEQMGQVLTALVNAIPSRASRSRLGVITGSSFMNSTACFLYWSANTNRIFGFSWGGSD